MNDNKPKQKIYAIMGESACYMLSILHLAETLDRKYVDAYRMYDSAILAGIMEPNCFVNKPEILLAMANGGQWIVKKVGPDYLPQSGEYEILRYEWQKVGETKSHFVVGDGMGGVDWDSYGDSLTVKNGKLVSKRIFRRVI